MTSLKAQGLSHSTAWNSLQRGYRFEHTGVKTNWGGKRPNAGKVAVVGKSKPLAVPKVIYQVVQAYAEEKNITLIEAMSLLWEDTGPPEGSITPIELAAVEGERDKLLYQVKALKKAKDSEVANLEIKIKSLRNKLKTTQANSQAELWQDEANSAKQQLTNVQKEAQVMIDSLTQEKTQLENKFKSERDEVERLASEFSVLQAELSKLKNQKDKPAERETTTIDGDFEKIQDTIKEWESKIETGKGPRWAWAKKFLDALK